MNGVLIRAIESKSLLSFLADKLFIYSLGLLLLKYAVPKNTKRTPTTVRIAPIICIYTELLLTAALMISAVPVNMRATAGSTISPLPIRQLSHLFFGQTLQHLVVSQLNFLNNQLVLLLQL